MADAGAPANGQKEWSKVTDYASAALDREVSTLAGQIVLPIRP
jgi:hypothetical protein